MSAHTLTKTVKVKGKTFKGKVAIVLIIFLLVFQAQPKSFASEANIELSSLFGAQGSEITILGSGFVAGGDVFLTLGDVDVTKFVTDAAGEFSGKFTVPAIASGIYKLKAEQPAHGIIVEMNFKIGFTIVIVTPRSGQPGTIVTITGTGFTPGGKWKAMFGDLTIVEDGMVDEETNLQLDGEVPTFQVPLLDPGRYNITVLDIETGIYVKVEFVVLEIPKFPTLSLSKYSGTCGDKIIVKSNDATPGREYIFYWDKVHGLYLLNKTLGRADGTLEVCFTVPDIDVGRYYLWVEMTLTEGSAMAHAFCIFSVVSSPSFRIVLSKYSGVYEDTIVVTGSGATAGADVSVYWNAVKAWDGEKGIMNSTDSNDSGEFEIWFKVPSHVGGTNYVWAKDKDTGNTACSEPFTVIASSPPEPAEFVVSNLRITPSEVEPGEQVSISVTVTNVGGESGSYTLVVKLDGEFFDSRSINIGVGRSSWNKFIISSNKEGSHKSKLTDYLAASL